MTLHVARATGHVSRDSPLRFTDTQVYSLQKIANTIEVFGGQSWNPTQKPSARQTVPEQ